jgi:hypothetical protein
MAINGESYVLALPRGNTTFRLTSIKPFNVLDIEAKADPLKPERNSQETESEEGIIVIDTSPTVPLKRGRGRPRKNADVTMFL